MEGACVTWIFVGMLVFRIGGGSGGWASVPLWCILLLARVVGFTQLTEFIVLIKKRFNIKFILYLRVYTFDKLFSPDRFSQLVYGRTYLLVETRFRTRDGIHEMQFPVQWSDSLPLSVHYSKHIANTAVYSGSERSSFTFVRCDLNLTKVGEEII